MNELIEFYEKIANGNASRHEIIDFLMSYESASMGPKLFIRMVTKSGMLLMMMSTNSLDIY